MISCLNETVTELSETIGIKPEYAAFILIPGAIILTILFVCIITLVITLITDFITCTVIAFIRKSLGYDTAAETESGISIISIEEYEINKQGKDK